MKAENKKNLGGTNVKMLQRMGLSILLSVSLFVFFQQIASASFDPDHRGHRRPNVFVNGNDWGRAVTVQGDYLRWLGQYRVNSAQAAYLSAVSAGEVARSRALARAVKTLENDLRGLEVQIYKLKKLSATVERHGKNVNRLVLGSVNASVITSVNYLIYLLPSKVLDTYFSKEIPALSGTDLKVTNPRRSVRDSETGRLVYQDFVLEDFTGGNVFEFLNWLNQGELRAKRGFLVHQQLVDLRADLADAAQSWLKVLEEKRVAQENRKLSIWGPVYSGEFGLPGRDAPENVEGEE